MTTFTRLSILGSLMLLANLARAETRTFIDPKLNGRYVDGCIDSFRYPGNENCSKEGSAEVAHEFCKIKGYKTWKQWKWSPYAETNSYMLKEFYSRGNFKRGFYKFRGRNLMDVIVCYR